MEPETGASDGAVTKSKNAQKKELKLKQKEEERKRKEEEKAKLAPRASSQSQNSVVADDDEDMDPTQYFENRLKYLAAEKAKGENPYPHKFSVSMSIPEYIDKKKEDVSSGSCHRSTSILTEADNGLNLEENNTNVLVLPNQTKDSTYCHAQIKAVFYPKFDNEKSDQEIRKKMIEMVSKGLATLEVTLKHSGSLFMYAGGTGEAYAKNSYGNIYTAVGVFVLSRMFKEAWGANAVKKEVEFNDYLQKNRMCISMELVTAVLGDHGQRPLHDYVVITAVAKLGGSKPNFYSTSEIIVFCREWRLPTNQVWLFSTSESVSSFFSAFDALCEEGIATSVCRALHEIADISEPGSIDHVKMQGEILEGLVARIVSNESARNMQNALRDHPQPPCDGANAYFGPTLRELCATHRSNEKEQIRALLSSAGPSFCTNDVDWFGDSEKADKSVVTLFAQSKTTDYSTCKLQEMVRLILEKRLDVSFKLNPDLHRANETSPDNLFYKMAVHVYNDETFSQYKKEMRNIPSLWPLYRGFFVDINLFKSSKGRDPMALKRRIDKTVVTEYGGGDGANLMIKLKFLPYKLRTFLIRNGLSTLYGKRPESYQDYYRGKMKNWGTSVEKQKKVRKMLDEWASYLIQKCGNRQLSSSIYLSEAEPFLELYAKRDVNNRVLIGFAGNLVRSEDFLAADGLVMGGVERAARRAKEAVKKKHQGGFLVFFPGIPGCGKSTLCQELVTRGGFGDDHTVQTLMGDLVKEKYWEKVADGCLKNPQSIILSDKNAPREDVWRKINKMGCSAVPIVTDSQGTDSNPYSVDALAVFMFRVLERVNHPRKLDKASSNAGYVLLRFYHLYEGKTRKVFEGELIKSFGSLIKMPLLKSDRSPLPDPVKLVVEAGIDLFKLRSRKKTYTEEWTIWEKQLRDTLTANSEYLNCIQVPFKDAVEHVREELKQIIKGENKPTTIDFVAINLPVNNFFELVTANPTVRSFLEGKKQQKIERAHVTLAHKGSHSVADIASYGQHLYREVPVELTELIFNNKMAALTASIGSVDIACKNEWPHVTLWTAQGVKPKEANTLPQLYSQGKATRTVIDPPVSITGTLEFYPTLDIK